MSKFFVGQRVRIVASHSFADRPFIGREAVITEVVVTSWGHGYGLDIYPIEYDPIDDGCWSWDDDELEAIVPPHQSSELSYTELMDRLKAGEVECV